MLGKFPILESKRYLLVSVLGAVLSVRGGGGVAPVRRGWWDGCDARMKVDIKSFNPEVKASKSVKRFQ